MSDPLSGQFDCTRLCTINVGKHWAIEFVLRQKEAEYSQASGQNNGRSIVCVRTLGAQTDSSLLQIPLTQSEDFALGDDRYDGSHFFPTPNQIEQFESSKIEELDQYKKKLIGLDTENIERKLIRIEEELDTRFGAIREALAERKLERAKRREQLRLVEHDGKELQILDHQSHDDSREIRRMKAVIRGETDFLKVEIRRRRREQSRLKKERAQIARSLQDTLRESFLWETILHMQPGEFPDSYRDFVLVRLFAAVARYGLENVEFSIVGDSEKDISEALQAIQREAQKLQQLPNKALSHLCALTKPEFRDSWLPPLELVYQDPWFVVVNKPSGLLSVPGRKWPEQDSVVTRVVLYFPHASGPLSVHRIDQATSGLQIVALTAQAHRELSMLFQAKRVKKTYFADVEGEVIENSGTIELPLKPHYTNRIRQMVDMKSGKKAVTNFQVLQRSESKTRLSLEPVTGRTHQLRVHCADADGLGHPILGDKIYGSSDKTENMRLHAGRVQFTHPFTGEEVDVSCLPPF